MMIDTKDLVENIWGAPKERPSQLELGDMIQLPAAVSAQVSATPHLPFQTAHFPGTTGPVVVSSQLEVVFPAEKFEI